MQHMTLWQQVPTTDQLEEFVGADDLGSWDFVLAVAIIVGAFVLSRFVRRFVRWALTKFPHITDEVAALIGRATGWVVILVGIVWALVVVGIEMVPALMVIIIIGIVTFFAGRRMMENFSAGLVLQSTPMFAPGDEIVTTVGTGEVREITGRTVIIMSPDGEEIHVPNQIVIDDAVTNLTGVGARRSMIEVGVAYGTDLELAKRVIEQAAADCDETRPNPEPEALFAEFGDNAVNFNLWFWHDPRIIERLRAIDVVGRSIAHAFAENGIVIAFPQRTLWWGEPGSDDSDTPEG
jgi:small conductance mechanosensitive channel